MTPRPDPLAERRAELERRLASLTAEQREKLRTPNAPAAPPARLIPARAAGAPVPMSFAQELLWLLERASPGHAYNVPRAVRLEGPIDRKALQGALDAVVARHEALRTTFTNADGDARQIVHPAATVEISTIDLSAISNAERETAARQQVRDLARIPFDLEHERPFRAYVIQLTEEDNVLLLVSHHVASDGLSGNILLRELASFYEGFLTGDVRELSPLPVQYADFASWQRRTLVGERRKRLLAYWRGQLEGAPPLLEFPTDRARSPAPSFEGDVVSLLVPEDAVNGLPQLARESGATTFMVLLSALYAVLFLYTGEEELVVGTPVAGRLAPELEGVIGFFTNTLLLRTSLTGHLTFRGLLARVRATALGAFDHQEIPLETLLLDREHGDRPLATAPQVLFTTEVPDREAFRLHGTTGVPFGAARGATKFELTLHAAERPGGLRLLAEFRTDLFDRPTIERFLRHYGVLLRAAIAAPDTPVSDLPLMDPAERRQVLLEWNDTDAGYPEGATVHGLIEEQVRRRPDAIAVQCTDRGVRTSLTYRELDSRANRLAWTLRDAGVALDDRVAICLERSVNTAVAIFGVLKAGGAYLPIDPAYPDDRIEFTVQDAGASLILTDGTNHPRLSSLSLDARLLDLDWSVRAGKDESGRTAGVAPHNLAYVIYTSGSTGRPKGVMVEHRNVTRLLINDRSLFSFDEHDVWTVFHSFAFDFSVWELFGALVFGGRAIIVPRLVAQSPSDFLALLEETGTTILNQVPSAFQALQEEAVARRPGLALRYVIFGGEALKPALLRRWRATWPSVRLINMFGITETTVHVTFKEIGDAEIAAGASNIGGPIPTTTVYLLDPALRPVPVGLVGEICVGGLGVARGYLNRPELTAERFVPNPFAAGRETGASLYRSGDLGRRLATGEIEYVGRRDHQVKIRGHRIELGEIEAVLLQQPGIAEAAVMVREDMPGDKRLAAYVVSDAGAVISISELRAGMRLSLPEVMVPSAIEVLPRLPLTSNGKIDLRALPAPRGGGGERSHQAPRTTIEHEIVQIWERLLRPGRPISAFDDFFELGGHSLLALQMLAEVERIRGQRIPLAWLFESSTVESLATRLSAPVLDAKEPPLVILQEGGGAPPVAFVHGDWTGGGWYARRIAPLVAPDAPFFVLPTIGADGESTPWTIEMMAARQVAELRKVQPNGPYQVVGFCVGGVIAFEMARQLRSAGQRVSKLVVIDSDPANARVRFARSFLPFLVMFGGNAEKRLARRSKILRGLRWGYGRLKNFGGMPTGAKIRWVGSNIARRVPRLIGLGGAEQKADAPSAGPAPAAETDEIMLVVQSRASSAYLPGRFDGAIDFIWAEGPTGRERRANPTERWQLLAPEVRVHPLPSGHIGLITDNLPLLATALRDALASEGGR